MAFTSVASVVPAIEYVMPSMILVSHAQHTAIAGVDGGGAGGLAMAGAPVHPSAPKASTSPTKLVPIRRRILAPTSASQRSLACKPLRRRGRAATPAGACHASSPDEHTCRHLHTDAWSAAPPPLKEWKRSRRRQTTTTVDTEPRGPRRVRPDPASRRAG